MPSAKKGAAGASTPKRAARVAAPKGTARRTSARKAASSARSAPALQAIASPATGGEAATAAPAPRRAARPAAGPMITIEQYGSGIGCIVRQKRTLRALGLRRPRQRVLRPDNPAVRGMVKSIPHLVRIVEGA